MKAIVAVDNNWGIGRNNQLLFSIPTDMKFFRQTTLNKVVVMGANTLKSFPNASPLKNRTNVVLSTTIKRDDCVVFDSKEKLLNFIGSLNSDDVFVIGGAKVYSELLDYCDEVLVTKVFANGDADVFFPNLDKMSNWKMVLSSLEQVDNGYSFAFTTYINNKVKKI